METPGYSRAAAVTLSDADQAFPFTQKAFYVGTGGGTLKITTSRGDVVTLTTPLAGTEYHIQVRRFWSTGTVTAAAIVALGD